MRMKAAVLYDPAQPLVVQEVDLAPPQRGEVLIRLVASGICHSDVNIVRGEAAAPLPVVLGHEASGYIEEVGQDVTSLKVGDPVAVSLVRSCGHCFYCVRGAPNDCEGAHPLASETRIHALNGSPITQGINVAGFAEYVVVDQSQVVRLPQTMPLVTAAVLGCAVITGVGAVVNTARVQPGSSVVVMGMGGVGINAVQAAALSGARRVIAVDVLDNKLAFASQFGSTHTLNASRENVMEAVQELTNGRGADYVFVTVGSPRAVTDSLSLVRKQGAIILIGLIGDDGTVPLPVSRVVLNEFRILGSFMGSSRISQDIPQIVDLYQQGRLKLDELITATYPIESINQAIEAMERGEAIRNLITFPSHN
ncbi:Zn-dependent alcohol dehydrogenase [Geitlerinema splendidum]|nr:Zn-dependent alcohol dehydrogenase [Geitlerinema splendidum]